MFLLNLLLALTWVALTGEISIANFVLGFIVGYVVLWLVQPGTGMGQGVLGTRYFVKVRRVIEFFFYFVYKLTMANLRVAYYVVQPRMHMRPGIVAVPLDLVADHEITTLVNIITLTPGTLSLDVSDDRRIVYVHVMHVEDIAAFRHEIKDGFERRIKEIFA